MMDRFVEGGLVTGLVGGVSEGKAAGLVRLLGVKPYIGDGRAREMAVNAVLPFLYAWAGMRRDRRLKETSFDLYRWFPKLPDNAVTREMADRLGDDLKGVQGMGARGQQGLIHMYKGLRTKSSDPGQWFGGLSASVASE